MAKKYYQITGWYGRLTQKQILESTISTEKESKADGGRDLAVRKVSEGTSTIMSLIELCCSFSESEYVIWLMKKEGRLTFALEVDSSIELSGISGLDIYETNSIEVISTGFSVIRGGIIDTLFISSQYPDTFLTSFRNIRNGTGLKIKISKAKSPTKIDELIADCNRSSIITKKFSNYHHSNTTSNTPQGNFWDTTCKNIGGGNNITNSWQSSMSPSINQWGNLQSFSEEYLSRILQNKERLIHVEFEGFGEDIFQLCTELSKSKSPSYPYPLNFALDSKVPALPMKPDEFPEADYDFLCKFYKSTSIEQFRMYYSIDLVALLLSLSPRDIPGIKYRWEPQFSVNPPDFSSSDHLVSIGHVLERGRPISEFNLSLQRLSEHVFITGKTGLGKTNTCKVLLSEVKKHCSIIVLESAKNEYYSWAIDNRINHFAPAYSLSKRLRFPIFELPTKEINKRIKTIIPISEHIGGLWNVISAAFPLEGPMIPILKRALYQVYEYCGWGTRGKDADFFLEESEALFPTVEDICFVISEIVEDLGYSGELRANIEAALINRLLDLMVGTRKDVFSENCNGFSIIDVLNSTKPGDNNAVICLDHLESEEDKALALGIFLLRLRETARLSDVSNNSINKIIVIEEAHRIIPNVSTGNNIDPSIAKSKQEAVAAFNDAIAEMRAYGIGFIIVDQSPSKVSIDVLRNIGTKVIHSVQEQDDRLAACSIIGEIPDVGDFMVGLERGFALIHSRGMQKPSIVQVNEYKTTKTTDAIKQDFQPVVAESDIEINEDKTTPLLYELISGELDKNGKLNIWRRKLAPFYSDYGVLKQFRNLQHWNNIVNGTYSVGLSNECSDCPVKCRIPIIFNLLISMNSDGKKVHNIITPSHTCNNILQLIEIFKEKSINNYSSLREFAVHFVKDIVLNRYTLSGKYLAHKLPEKSIENLISAIEKCIALHSNNHSKLQNFVQCLSRKKEIFSPCNTQNNYMLISALTEFRKEIVLYTKSLNKSVENSAFAISENTYSLGKFKDVLGRGIWLFIIMCSGIVVILGSILFYLSMD